MNGKLNNLLFYGQENNNTNQNYNNIKINNNQNYYNYNKPIKTDFSLENHMSFKGKFEKPENIDFYIHPVTDAYENINDSNNNLLKLQLKELLHYFYSFSLTMASSYLPSLLVYHK